MIKISELKRIKVKIIPSVRTVIHQRIEPGVLTIICAALKKKYDAIPWKLVTVIVDIPKPNERYIPEELKDLFDDYGLDWPSEEEREGSDLRVKPEERTNVNEEKIAILNRAVNLGCIWAIEEMENLSGILFQED